MGIFDWGKAGEVAKGVGEGVGTAVESIRFALTGDLPPEERIKLEGLLLDALKVEAGLREQQIDLNKIDARSPNFFKAGWRPMLAWVGVTGFSLVFVVFPILSWVVNLVIVFKHIALTPEQLLAIKPPDIDAMTLFNLLVAMLGIGTLRTIEKGNGITK